MHLIFSSINAFGICVTAYILTGAGSESAAETNATERETRGRESEPATATVIATETA
jgi:hypothetical protein